MLNSLPKFHENNNQDVNQTVIPNFANLNINASVCNSFCGILNNENKFICNYEVQIENDEHFRITKRIIGNKGLYLKAILYDSCGKYGDYSTKIRLRGRGSGFKEGPNHTGKK